MSLSLPSLFFAKAGGIADVLDLTQSFAEALPDLGKSLEQRFCAVLVEGLTSSKADIRSAMESLLDSCVARNVVSLGTLKKSAGKMKPAKQRSVGPILAKLSSNNGESASRSATEEEAEERNASRTSMSQKSKKNSVRQNPIAKKISAVLESEAEKLKPQEHRDSRNSAVTNPLVGNNGPAGLNKSKAASRALTWPDYPEEPLGTSLYNGLKKAWSPLLPPDSAKKLFPDGGIRKQDDAMDGCDLLSRAMVMERSGEEFALIEQFDLILKWTAFVLCSKESTVGLQALLAFFFDLFDFLRETKYELSDSEAITIIPWIFDKASIAKVRSGNFKNWHRIPHISLFY